jgi:uncharacterized membrane protein
MKKTIALPALVASAVAVAGVMASSDAHAAGKEKCYGVAKAGQNDCQTATSSCAGTSRVDNQKDAFIVVPKGLCAKLAGGSETPKS